MCKVHMNKPFSNLNQTKVQLLMEGYLGVEFFFSPHPIFPLAKKSEPPASTCPGFHSPIAILVHEDKSSAGEVWAVVRQVQERCVVKRAIRLLKDRESWSMTDPPNSWAHFQNQTQPLLSLYTSTTEFASVQPIRGRKKKKKEDKRHRTWADRCQRTQPSWKAPSFCWGNCLLRTLKQLCLLIPGLSEGFHRWNSWDKCNSFTGLCPPNALTATSSCLEIILQPIKSCWWATVAPLPPGSCSFFSSCVQYVFLVPIAF